MEYSEDWLNENSYISRQNIQKILDTGKPEHLLTANWRVFNGAKLRMKFDMARTIARIHKFGWFMASLIPGYDILPR